MRILPYVLAAAALAAGAVGCRRAESGTDAAAAGAPRVIAMPSGAEMVALPGGWFEMGSDGGRDNERPVHRVWVDSFLIDRREVTQGLFERLQVSDPSHFKGLDRPVEQATMAEVIDFCNRRSEAEGLEPCYTVDEMTGAWACNFGASGYRLPTEAEWEYACRSGTTTERFFGGGEPALRQHAWYAANAGGQTQPVGTKQPNAWGLFDMYGNVAEWCHDWYDADYYGRSPQRNPRGPESGRFMVIRGGAWDAPAERCRSAWRDGEDPRFHDICFAQDTVGFRCVRRAAGGAAAGG